MSDVSESALSAGQRRVLAVAAVLSVVRVGAGAEVGGVSTVLCAEASRGCGIVCGFPAAFQATTTTGRSGTRFACHIHLGEAVEALAGPAARPVEVAPLPFPGVPRMTTTGPVTEPVEGVRS